VVAENLAIAGALRFRSRSIQVGGKVLVESRIGIHPSIDIAVVNARTSLQRAGCVDGDRSSMTNVIKIL
jgi:hypothetical protein